MMQKNIKTINKIRAGDETKIDQNEMTNSKVCVVALIMEVDLWTNTS